MSYGTDEARLEAIREQLGLQCQSTTAQIAEIKRLQYVEKSLKAAAVRTWHALDNCKAPFWVSQEMRDAIVAGCIDCGERPWER